MAQNTGKVFAARLLCGLGIVPATVILALVTLMTGLLLGQGVLPGAYDRITDGLIE